MKYRPHAKNRDVATESIDGELVVYDSSTQTAHCLSADAAAVWERCDGSMSLAEIASDSSLELTAVERAVSELHGCGLLDDGPVAERGYSRREAALKFGKVGGAALLAPLVYSVAVPAAASAASTTCSPPCGPGTYCDSQGACCTNGLLDIGGACTTDADCCGSLICLSVPPLLHLCAL